MMFTRWPGVEGFGHASAPPELFMHETSLILKDSLAIRCPAEPLAFLTYRFKFFDYKTTKRPLNGRLVVLVGVEGFEPSAKGL
jgi:hypothetical protein